MVASAPASNKILLLEYLNARVGRNAETWERVIGKHGVGKEKANGTLLLSFCLKMMLHEVITNTIFQKPNRRKTTWMHPRSKHWYLIDYIIVRQLDQRDVYLTRAAKQTTKMV